MKSLQEIIDSVNSDDMKNAWVRTRESLSQQLADQVTVLLLERSNPLSTTDEKDKIFKLLEDKIKTLGWAIEDIDSRLDTVNSALKKG